MKALLTCVNICCKATKQKIPRKYEKFEIFHVLKVTGFPDSGQGSK